MKNVKWIEDYEVGISEIDDQHKMLFDIINEVIDFKNGDHLKEDLFEVIKKLLDYAQFHFQTEEDYMKETGYPDLEAHKEQHKVFSEKIVMFDIEAQFTDELIVSDLLTYLVKWFLNHIMKIDKKYASV